MPRPRPLHVREDFAGATLAEFLRQVPADLGASEVRTLIEGRQVQLNGNLCNDANRRLQAGDVVKVLPHPRAAPPTERDVRIRFLDSHLVVVEKPAGMTTMRYGDEVSASGRRNRQPTLLELLPRLVARRETGAVEGRSPPGAPKRSKNRAGPRDSRRSMPRPRVLPVHRLDRDTSGLMVFARTSEADRALTAMFREHDFRRVYLAVALGEVAAGVLESFLADDRGDGQRGSVPDPARGKRAVTHVRPVESFAGYSLIECRLETGRTHQIRIHLAEQGHPLCGDRIYRSALGQRPVPDQSHAPRLALHAAELEFSHPITARELSFRSPLPDDLRDFIQRLRGDEPMKDGTKTQTRFTRRERRR